MEQIQVNYKNKKRYKTARYPIRQPRILNLLIYILSKISLMKRKYKIEKINMEGLKPPYIMISNHQYFVDFELAAIATFPHRMNNVVNIDGYINRAWLLEVIGSICTRKFANDYHLIKSIKKVLKRGDVLGMYPEARYSPCGTNAHLPESLAKLIKSCKVPVALVMHHGNHLESPFWAWKKKRKVPLYTTIEQILTAEDVEKLSVSEIYDVLNKKFVYDEYKYQKENNIKITEKYRAEKIHKILYKCPHCHTERKMNSKGTEFFCEECGKRWNLNEDGSITCLNGETIFDHIPDWFNWERQEVRKEVRAGTYKFEDDVKVYSLPRTNGAIYLGEAKVRHTIEEGFVLEGYYNNAPYRIIRSPLQSIGLHVEYDYVHVKHFDCFDITTEDDCYFCYPTKNDVVSKLAFAVEELYILHQERVNESKK